MDASAISWVDWTLLAILALSIVVGAARGFVFEIMSLAGWFVAWFAARAGAPFIAPQLPVGTPGSLANGIAGFAFVFVVVLILWAIVTRLVRGLLHATPLKPVDRLLGAAFGLLRGALALLLLALVVGWSPAADMPAWRTSWMAAWLTGALHELAPLLPGRSAPSVPV